MEKPSVFLSLIGYCNPRDLLLTVFGKSIVVNLLATVQVMAVAVAGFIYNEPAAIVALLALATIDLITGTLKAAKLKTLSSNKWQRTFWKVLVQLTVICATYQLGKLGGLLGFAFQYIPNIALLSFISREFLSIIENVNIIDSSIIPDKFTQYIQGVSDLDKTLAAYAKKLTGAGTEGTPVLDIPTVVTAEAKPIDQPTCADTEASEPAA
jgi:phage-related holin